MNPARVLVIDDSTTLRKLVEIAMRGTGFDIDFAATGSDGVTRARAARPDVILLDYLLPDLQSTEVCQRLCDHGSTSKVPVVVMSANQDTVFEAFKRFPAVVDFVGKPFSPGEIRARLELAIRNGEPVSAAASEIAPPADGPPIGELELRGDLTATPLLEVLRLLTSSNATGTLTIWLADTFRVHIRRGDILLCTTSRFDHASLGSAPAARIPPELLARARGHQQSAGKPALVTLAQAGAIPVNDLPAELHRAAGRLLEELLGATTGRFAWRATLTLPDYVDAFGRHLSITSIALAHRRGPTAALPAAFLDEVYDRMPRFSDKLAGARLSSEEQRLLTLVDGRHRVRDILARTQISSDQAAAIFARLRNAELIRSDDSSGTAEIAGGVVVVLDSDPEFVTPLGEYLARRPQPLDLIAPPIDDLDASELAHTLMKLRPRLAIVNPRRVTADLALRELGAVARGGMITIAAILEFPDPAEVDGLLRAGLHAVLVKPLHENDLERLLGL
jgi:CheY-like chemotaxis protein/predicted nucleic acid-binding protein